MSAPTQRTAGVFDPNGDFMLYMPVTDAEARVAKGELARTDDPHKFVVIPGPPLKRPAEIRLERARNRNRKAAQR